MEKDQLVALKRDAKTSLSTNHVLLNGLAEARAAQRGEIVGRRFHEMGKAITTRQLGDLTDAERQAVLDSEEHAFEIGRRIGIKTQAVIELWREAGRDRRKKPGRKKRVPLPCKQTQ